MKYWILLFFLPVVASEQPSEERTMSSELRKSTFVDMPSIEVHTPIPRRDAQNPLVIARQPSQEIHIHIEKDTPSTPANSEDTEDTIPKHRHNRRMIVSNSVSAIIATLITAGVTLTVHFTSCKK